MYSNNVLIMILYTDSVQGLPNVLIMVYWLQMKHTIMRFWFVFIYIYIYINILFFIDIQI